MKVSIGRRTPLYPAPAVVLAVWGRDDRPCGMTAAWAGVCNSDPPCLCVSVQKVRWSYAPLLKRGAFSVNVPGESLVKVVDYFGTYSCHDRDKFAETGLTVRAGKFVEAPIIEEFPISFECKVVESHDLGSHVQFIGQVMDCTVEETALDCSGLPDPEVIKPVIFMPNRGLYYGIGELLGRAWVIGKEIAKSADEKKTGQ